MSVDRGFPLKRREGVVRKAPRREFIQIQEIDLIHAHGVSALPSSPSPLARPSPSPSLTLGDGGFFSASSSSTAYPALAPGRVHLPLRLADGMHELAVGISERI